MFFKKEKFSLNEIIRMNSELDLNIYVRKLSKDIVKDIRFELIIESILRSVLYYVCSCKENEEKNLKQVLLEIEMSKNKDENPECFINKVNTFPIDHPARMYFKEVSSISQEELVQALDKILDIIKIKTK